jgi:hypothetical protein
MVEEGGAGDAAVRDPYRVGAGVAGQLPGVEVPGCPGSGVVLKENSGVLGVGGAGVVTGADCIQAVVNLSAAAASSSW